MTPERARELVYAAFDRRGYFNSADMIDAILQACAEEREACAKNMDEAAEDVAEWGAYAPAYFQDKWNLQKAIKKWKDRAAAIRGGA